MGLGGRRRRFAGVIGVGFVVEESEVGELAHQGPAVPPEGVKVAHHMVYLDKMSS